MPRPNILILMPDQFRADCLSCAGHPQMKTPNLDSIASQGTRFTQAASVSPVCMPARASFISSRYPHNHGMWRNSGCLPANDESLFHHLQRAGYCTAHIGKSHYYPHGGDHMRNYEDYMHARGLEYVHEVTGPWATTGMRSYMTDRLEEHGLYEAFKRDYQQRREARKEKPLMVKPSPLPPDLFLDSYVGDKATKYVGEYEDQRPMCLFVGFPGPHEPWDAPGEYAEMYDEDKTPDPIPWPQENRDLPPETRDMDDFQPKGSTTPENISKIQANYFGKISLIDHWIGQILGALQERNMLEDTMVVFWSDHGEMLGDHRRVFKSTFHESSMRVPLIMSWPGHFQDGETSDVLAETVDIFPTILDSLGLEASERSLGRSLNPVLSGESDHLRTEQLSEVLHAGERRACLRTRERKYAIREDGSPFMLYQLRDDLQEQHNLIGDQDPSDLRDRLLCRLMESQYSMRHCPEI